MPAPVRFVSLACQARLQPQEPLWRQQASSLSRWSQRTPPKSRWRQVRSCSWR